MKNPEKAIDAILDDEQNIGGIVVKPLTIARYALLERMNSPILTCKTDSVEDVMTTLYVMTADVKDLVGKSNTELRNAAYVWADDVPPPYLGIISQQIIRQLSDVKYVAPDGKDDGTKKKEAPTDG